MNSNRISRTFALLMLAPLCAACVALPPLMAPGAPGTAAPLPGSPAPTPWPPLVAAQSALAGQLGILQEAITYISSEPMEWRDGCLELAAPGEMCTMAIVPGYRIVVEANGQQYVVHTDQSGSNVRVAGPLSNAPSTPAAEDAWPPAAGRAREALTGALALAMEDVRIVSVEAVEWPDACLGIYVADEACAQVVTPGYKVILQAGDARHEYHTDAAGDVLRPLPVAAGAETTLAWRGLTAEGCIEARFDSDAMAFGPCDGELEVIPLSDLGVRAVQLDAFAQTYQPFSASTPAGIAALAGQGPFAASPAEQRMLAEWAARVVAEVEDAQGLAMWGLGWHREGGIAGFCDDLAIDATGYVELAPCRYESPQAVAIRTLAADELALFYGWLDTLAPFEFTQRDPATADSMTIRYFFAGRGAQQATDADVQTLVEFAAEVLARWPAPSEVQTIQMLADTALYAGPGVQYPVAGQVNAGETAVVTGILRGGTWWRVMCPDETLGNCWVSADPQVTQPTAIP